MLDAHDVNGDIWIYVLKPELYYITYIVIVLGILPNKKKKSSAKLEIEPGTYHEVDQVFIILKQCFKQ